MNCRVCGTSLFPGRAVFNCSCGAFIHAYCWEKHVLETHEPPFAVGTISMDDEFSPNKTEAEEAGELAEAVSEPAGEASETAEAVSAPTEAISEPTGEVSETAEAISETAEAVSAPTGEVSETAEEVSKTTGEASETVEAV
ncbi:MAG: hypothetical protein V3T71_03490, partial [Dehalococcoidia bacterium]